MTLSKRSETGKGKSLSCIFKSSITRAITKFLGTLSKDDDDGSENDNKQMNLRSFKLTRVYLDSLDMSTAGDFS